MSTICAWDWQAIAGLAQAAAIVVAALLARASIDNFLRSRSETKRADVADEAAVTAARLVRKYKLYTALKNREALELCIEAYGLTPSFEFFDRNFTNPVDASLDDASRLRELGLAGELYLGADFEMACRRIAVCYEHLSNSAQNLKTTLDLASQRARLEEVDIVARMTQSLQSQTKLISLLDGVGEQAAEHVAILDSSLSILQSKAASYIK